jgi:acetyltransferase-like isoleucine patch superfamily enzyme
MPPVGVGLSGRRSLDRARGHRRPARPPRVRRRAAEPDPDAPGGWRVNAWVKRRPRVPPPGPRRPARWVSSRHATGLRSGSSICSTAGRSRTATLGHRGGSSRAGPRSRRRTPRARGRAHAPSYVNVGAWVGRETRRSHVLVGSCAQVGAGVHLSAGVQVGGVLEPVGARPVIVEDGAFVGGGCGLYDGVVVSVDAVLAAGVVLTGSSRIVDLVGEREIVGSPDAPPLVVPRGGDRPGVRPAGGAFAAAASSSATGSGRSTGWPPQSGPTGPDGRGSCSARGSTVPGRVRPSSRARPSSG